MTLDIDYPPTREYTLAQARDRIDERLAELGDDDSDDERELETYRDGLAWAIDEFGGDATIALEAFTARERDRAVDTLQSDLVGVGATEMSHYLTAVQVEHAPWLDDDMGLIEHGQVIGQLPPAVVDWLNHELDDLNALGTEGN